MPGARVDAAFEDGAARRRDTRCTHGRNEPHASVVEVAERLIGAHEWPSFNVTVTRARRRPNSRLACTRITRNPAADFAIGKQSRRQRHRFDVMTREHQGERIRRTEFRLEFVVRIRWPTIHAVGGEVSTQNRGDVARAARWRREDVAQPFERLEAAQAKRVSLEDVAQDCPALAQAVDEDRREVAAARGFAGACVPGCASAARNPLSPSIEKRAACSPSRASLAALTPRSAASPDAGA
jgi:hypothetical protein